MENVKILIFFSFLFLLFFTVFPAIYGGKKKFFLFLLDVVTCKGKTNFFIMNLSLNIFLLLCYVFCTTSYFVFCADAGAHELIHKMLNLYSFVG